MKLSFFQISQAKHKKHKREKKSKKRRSSSEESSSETEWVEKSLQENENYSKMQKPNLDREDWLGIDSVFASSSTMEKKESRDREKRKQKEEEKYNPSRSSRELNPYWKDGGSGLPTFKKPTDDLDDYGDTKDKHKRYNWKNSVNDRNTTHPAVETASKSKGPLNLDPNVIAAKLVKAEIMGNVKLVEELKQKLEEAKTAKTLEDEGKNEILLTETDAKGFSRPLKGTEENHDNKRKKRKVETYSGGERTKYFPDDDKYSLKQMFEAEKYNSADSSNKEFAEMAANVKKNDSLDDIFVDKISREGRSKEVEKAIGEQRRVIKSVDNCTRCLQSENSLKYLTIEYNNISYVSLPSFEPLTEGHCLLSPVRHVSCSTLLDENEWNEMKAFRLKLVDLFGRQDKTVIFFEMAKSLHKHPHMVIECVPVPKRKGDAAPIYFKKAIEESETEWSMNKKLISLKGRDVIKAVPKGLPYFFVSFGMNEGFAHVIEDQSQFPANFAQEIIGGMLDIHHSKWRRPVKTSFDSQKSRVSEFKNWWRSL